VAAEGALNTWNGIRSADEGARASSAVFSAIGRKAKAKRCYSPAGLTVFRSDAPQVAQPYSTSEPSRARICGVMRLIVIGRRFSQAGQSTIGISRTGPGRLGIDPNKPAAAADALGMVLLLPSVKYGPLPTPTQGLTY
jgi:hypothetical protein